MPSSFATAPDGRSHLISAPGVARAVRREIKWLRPPPSLPADVPQNTRNSSDALSHLTYDVLTLLLGWLGPHEALRAAAVSKTWLAALAHAQWRVIELVAKADPRPTSLQLTAILAPQCITSLEVLRLRMVTAGSFVWHDPAMRIPALQHCRRLRTLELTEVNIPLADSVITVIAAGCATSLEEVRIGHIGHGMSVGGMVALLQCPKLRRLHICKVHGRPLDSHPAGLPWDAARKLESFRCEVGEAPLEWLALFTQALPASLRDLELFGSFACGLLQEALQPLVDFLGSLVSIAVETRRLRLPRLECRLLPHLDRMQQAEEARTALRSYPFVTISLDPFDRDIITLRVQKKDDCPIATAMAGLTTGGDEE